MGMRGLKDYRWQSGVTRRWTCQVGTFLFLLFFVGVGHAKAALPEDAVMDQIQDAVKEYVAARLLQASDAIDVRHLSPLPPHVHAPVDRVIVLQGGGGDHRGLVGRSTFLIGVTSPSGDERQHWINADVSVIREVWMATRVIERGEILTPDAFSRETLYQTRLDEQYVDTEAELVGQQASRTILPGEPLTPSRMKDAPVIKRGDRVTLLVEQNGIRITAIGRAKGDGFLGRPLAVVPLDSAKIIYGIVVDAATVRVAF